MKRHNNFPMSVKAMALEPLKKSTSIPRPRTGKPMTPYMEKLIKTEARRRRETEGRALPKILGQDMLQMLHVAGDRTIKGIARDLGMSPALALVTVDYLKKRRLVETWLDRRKNMCVGGV